VNLAYLIGQSTGSNLIIDQATVDGRLEVHLYVPGERLLALTPEEARTLAAALMLAAETPEPTPAPSPTSDLLNRAAVALYLSRPGTPPTGPTRP
jgi:hypothetical protein